MYIGIDVGGTNLKAGLVDQSGTILAVERTPLDFRGPESFADTLASLAKAVMASGGAAAQDVEYVGIGIPGAVAGGDILYTANIPMKNVPLEKLFRDALGDEQLKVKLQPLADGDLPLMLLEDEQMRRYREMSSIGGGMNFYGSMPQMYDIKVNMENPVMAKIWADREGTADLLHQVVDLALLSNGLLTGKALADFIARSQQLLGK